MRRISLSVLLLALTQCSVAWVQVEARQQPDVALPDCANQCLATSLPITSCDPTDTTCLCTDQRFLDTTAACVQSNCSIRDTLTTTRIQTTQLCPQPVRDDSATTREVVWSIFGIAAFSVIARLISRLPLVGGSGYGWDDWTIFLALLLLVPLNVLCYLMALIGLGRDIWMADPLDSITEILYYFWIDEYLYTFVLDITKISILLLYLRMWPDAESQRFRHCCLFLIGVLAVHAVVMNIALAASCDPVEFAWTQWDGEHEGHCISYSGQIYATAAINIVFDLLVFLLPIPKLAKLSFSSQRKKIALCLTFMLGLFVTVCSIIRLRYLAVWGNSSNLTWGYNPIAMWSNIECNGSVVCACMPSLAGIIQRIWARIAGTPLSSYGRNSVNDDMRSGDYELRLRSTSVSRATLRDQKAEDQMHSNGGSGKNPTAYPDGDVTSNSVTKWYATRPLPKVSSEMLRGEV